MKILSTLLTYFSLIYIVHAQNSRIELAQGPFKKVIVCNNEEIHGFSKETKSYALTYIDKDKLLAYYDSNPRNTFSKSRYTDKDIEKIAETLEEYLASGFDKNDTINVTQPSTFEFMASDEVFYNANVALYHIIKAYLGYAVQTGEIKIKYLATGKLLDHLELRKTEEETVGPVTKAPCVMHSWTYIIPNTEIEYYGFAEYKKIN
jgi:hypothetical protein